MRIPATIISLLASSSLAFCQAVPKVTLNLSHWQFSRDSINWQAVSVPHDWAISGPFDKKWDLQHVAVVQDGETEASEHSGRSGALPWIGEGWYTTTVHLSTAPQHAMLCFDGAMSEPRVTVNGHPAGYWAYGYNAFRLDVTPYLKAGANRIDVHLQNVEESSRWYPGAGIYRPVQLVTTAESYIDPWQTAIRTIAADSAKAVVTIDGQVCGPTDQLYWRAIICGPDGTADSTLLSKEFAQQPGRIHAKFTISKPLLWSPETPSLYRVKVQLYRRGLDGQQPSETLVDESTVKTGIRTVSVDSIHGFRLNGVSRKLKGVCLHHDLGPLGAAVNRAAIERQIRIMKEMGADAIRTSHNMPSQLQMEVCDSMGMMVMAESFDMWRYPKCKNGYSRFFDQWADKDIHNLIVANRNHPSIVMWSIGNEIPEQWSEEGKRLSMHLQDLCHQLDPTRPVTQGIDRAEDALRSGFAQVMDIPGFNYRVYKYARNVSQLPQRFLLGSETASTVSSRGIYHFPMTWGPVSTSDQVDMPDTRNGVDHHSSDTNHNDGQCTSYDTHWCSWSNLPEEDFMAMEDEKYTIGQFVWTGFDYLGEPTPYNGYWPSRSSYFGICDLAGLPKDRYYLYRSVWNTKEHTLHILPHWTWPGREGQTTPVFVYTDYPEAELFVNGKSQGRIRKTNAEAINPTTTAHPAMPAEAEGRAKRYRLMWPDVKYEPGVIRVVAYDANGKKAMEASQRTAGKAKSIRLDADKTVLRADGQDLSYITVSLADAKGTLLPTATDNIKVEVSGSGTFRGICNGDATSLEVFTEPQMHLFSGKLVVTVQAGKQAGKIYVKVTDTNNGLSKVLTIKTRQ